MNPFDRPALGLALSLAREKSGSVTVLSMGPAVARVALLEALAMGADRAVLLSDPALGGADTLATSRALAAGIQKTGPYDLVIFGARTADSDSGQVGPQVATLVGLPYLGLVKRMEMEGKDLTLTRLMDGLSETWRARAPLAFSVHASAQKPGDLSLGALESAFDSGEIEVLDLAGLGLSPDEVGEAGSPTRVASLARAKKQGQCSFLEGSVKEKAEALWKTLSDQGLVG